MTLRRAQRHPEAATHRERPKDLKVEMLNAECSMAVCQNGAFEQATLEIGLGEPEWI